MNHIYQNYNKWSRYKNYNKVIETHNALLDSYKGNIQSRMSSLNSSLSTLDDCSQNNFVPDNFKKNSNVPSKLFIKNNLKLL